jgi:hypothetical protein
MGGPKIFCLRKYLLLPRPYNLFLANYFRVADGYLLMSTKKLSEKGLFMWPAAALLRQV